ncbi:hypothetical protein [Butyrivibrio sp. INlla21]|uniref:hypothetical protein n=1 Tax=Butyrivibrio sp. INlla21 TaxID=1520811 RepID=UPI0008DEE40E|nr:hypothetical protein [Butyrivibrio sp. INlla21]SFU57023.1 hypothetical protein SAMN02910342_00922 [Butyrivibrio sp. INlla21]
MEEIKLYRREIKPMHYEHGTQGFSPRSGPIDGYDFWYPEDKENWLRKELEPELEKHHGWIELTFKERYVDYGDKYIICNAEDFPKEC